MARTVNCNDRVGATLCTIKQGLFQVYNCKYAA
jgi:hypothetical protein